MLNRRQLRIKVMQALYAFFQSNNDRLDLGEKQLIKSIEKIYELYIFQLSIIIEIVEFAKIRIEEGKKKFFPTEEDLDPNTRFINNSFLNKLSMNRNLLRKIDEYKISWVDETEIIRKIYKEFKDGNEYKTYMKEKENSYSSDKEIVIKLLKKYIGKSQTLQHIYEEKSIYWTDDYHLVTLLIIKTIKGYEEHHDEFTLLPKLYKEGELEHNEDKAFIKDLFRKTIINSNEYEGIISKKAKNWELDRIAIMDVILIKMAISELVDFPSIPIKVTLNEYIEISKHYSTEKSKIFINGILDKLIEDFRRNNKIKKYGRGLIE